VKRRLEARMRTMGCHDFSEYLVYLNHAPQEYDRLLEALTVNVTEFFRDPETFSFLQKKIIPKIIEKKEREERRLIRVWSAGSSSGEEAYSAAILFLETLKNKAADFQLRVYGTDLDPACIREAKQGVYEPSRVKNIPQALLKKYFWPSQGGYAVKDFLKEIVRFEPRDLTQQEPLLHLDLILCRNVLIYFTRPLQEKIYAAFARALNEEGVLVLGKVESITGASLCSWTPIDVGERIYQKKTKHEEVAF
jgi:chemotaxis protein methyltransferase CheR